MLNPKEKRGRRRARFTLRFLAISVLVFAVGFAILARGLQQNCKRLSAVRALAAKGADISLVQLAGIDDSVWIAGDPFGPDPFSSMDAAEAKPQPITRLHSDLAAAGMENPFGPPINYGSSAEDTMLAKVCRLLGEEPPIVVQGIAFDSRSRGQALNDEDFERLALFPEIGYVELTVDQISERHLQRIAALPQLINLSLSCKRFPDSQVAFGTNSTIEHMHLSGRVDDNAIRSASKLSQLWNLTVSDELTATDSLRELSKLTALRRLQLQCDPRTLSRTLPALPHVQWLKILPNFNADDQTSPSIQFLSKFPKLKSLHLVYSSPFYSDPFAPLPRVTLDRQIPAEEFKLLRQYVPRLQLLAARDVDDQALAEICKLESLRHLDVSHCRITDAGMIHIANMNKLQHLDISSTQTGDEGLRHIWDLNNLNVLMCEETKITQKVRDEYFQSHPSCASGLFICGGVIGP